MQRLTMTGAIAMLLSALPAHAQDTAPLPVPASAASLAGEYVHSQHELVSGIRLNEDGTFLYGLTVGSLDEQAQGKWKLVGNRIELTSEPRPVAPTITAGTVETGTGKPFAMRVVTPGGRDVPGVDFTIELEGGEELEDYMPGSAWSFPERQSLTPRFVTFEMSSYRVRSQRLPLDARDGTTANFILTPNDFGVLDLTGTPVQVDGEILTLQREEGQMRYRRIKRDMPAE